MEIPLAGRAMDFLVSRQWDSMAGDGAEMERS